MLTKVEITNFKSFNENFTFDLSKTNSFEFNQECISNGIINKAIIYGHNGCGKSNLGFAIFDLVSHLTDKKFPSNYYDNYLNADNNEDYASFKFKFKFDNNHVEYLYTKSNYQTLISEELIINGKQFAYIDKNESKTFTTTSKGTETLKNDLGDSNISIISYIAKNSILDDNESNTVFLKFTEFIESMLYFRNLDDRPYIGYEQGTHSLSDSIVTQGNLNDFENLLNEAGIKCRLISKEIDGKYQIFFKFKNKEIDFFKIASSGSKALIVFYFWYQRLKKDNDIKFIFIDEFDAFYHHDVSRLIIEKLKEVTDTQIILTTHNTAIISNDLLRPDCYFLMHTDKIQSLSKSTPQELRKAHNIEKMYRAGAFE